MTRQELHQRRKFLRKENAKHQPWVFKLVPQSEWPTTPASFSSKMTACWRSREFLVQVFRESGAICRLSICRTEMDDKGEWRDGITWDEMQGIKRGVGYGNWDAIEIYPADVDIVNVANLRHIWVVDATMLPFAWRANNQD